MKHVVPLRVQIAFYVALLLLITTAAEARDLRYRLRGGATVTSGTEEYLGRSLEIGVSYPFAGVLMASLDLGAELLPPRWSHGNGTTLNSGSSALGERKKITLVSMIAGFELLTRGRDLPGPILSAGFGWARFRPADERWANDTIQYDGETRLAGEIGAGVNVPLGSVSVRLLMHAADFRNKNAEDHEVRWRSRLQVEF